MHYQFEPIADDNIFEEFCLDLYNSIYNTKDFQLYKTTGVKQHGIDIYSIHHKIVIQCKKKKLLRSDRELRAELIKDINDSIMLSQDLPFGFSEFIIITTTKKFGEVEDEAAKLSQSNGIKIRFVAWEDIEKYLSIYVNLRKKYYSHLYTLENERNVKILNYLPSVDIRLISSRAEEITSINNLVENNSRFISISGIGGIGKTTLTKLYLHSRLSLYDHILWIDQLNSDSLMGEPFIDSFVNNFNLLKNLNLEFPEETTKIERFKFILNSLSNLKGNNIIIIDSATRDILKYWNFFPNSTNWLTIVNSRENIDGFTNLTLSSLSPTEAILLFYSHYNIEHSNELVYNILKRLDNHTLTVELISKTAQKRSILLNELNELIEKEGVNISKAAKVSTEHDSYSSKNYPFEYLLSIFSLLLLMQDQKYILQQFSILPSINISYENIKMLILNKNKENDFFDHLNELVETGWLSRSMDLYSMHPIIQEIIRHKLPTMEGSSDHLIASLSSKLTVDFHENPLEVSDFITYGESVCKYIKGDSIQIAGLYRLLGLRNEDIGDLEKSKYCVLKAIKILELNDNNSEDLAICYNNLHSVLKTQGDIEEAILYLNKALQIQKQTQEYYHPDLASSYNNLSLLYKIKGDLSNAIKYQKLAVDIVEFSLEENHPLLASAYANYSLLLHQLGDISQAIRYQEKAFEMRKLSLDQNHPLMAESYNNLSGLYYDINKFELAGDYLQKSIEIRVHLYGDKHYSLGSAYNNLAALLLKKGLLLNAEKYQLLAIEIEQNSLGENHYELATTYSTLAYIKYQQGDIVLATKITNKALDILKINFPNGHPNIEMLTVFKKDILGICD